LFLADTVESILAQDFTDSEILFSDDGSTDGSVALIERYAGRDPRIRWWRNPRNLGLAANFNLCLREARGEFIKFVLQDDTLLQPSVVRRMVAELEKDPTVSLVASASHVIDAESRWLQTRDYFPAGVWDGADIAMDCLDQNGNLIGEPSLVMFRRAQAARGFDENYVQIVDLEMWFHLLSQGNFAYFAEPLCAFRKHPNQKTEVNRRAGVGQQESLVLLETYFAKPWLRRLTTHQMLFSSIYSLRHQHGERADRLIAAMQAEISPSWRAYYWLKRKLTRPFKKIWRHLDKHYGLPPAPTERQEIFRRRRVRTPKPEAKLSAWRRIGADTQTTRRST
jgi:glycosyltransferase involved in cell wall biosynthesis